MRSPAAAIVTFGLVLGVASPLRTQPEQEPGPSAGQAPAQPAVAESAQHAVPPPPADRFKFASAAAAIFWIIKADQTEAFESVWSVIRARLAASTNADLRALNAGLTIYKTDTPPGQDATYVFVADPASKTTSYGVSPFLLYGSGLFERPEADELFATLQGATAQVTPVALDAVK